MDENNVKEEEKQKDQKGKEQKIQEKASKFKKKNITVFFHFLSYSVPNRIARQ